MATIADVYVQVIPSMEGTKGTLTSLMDSEANSAGTKASGTFGSSFSGGLTTVAALGASAFGVFTAAVAGTTSAFSSGISQLASYTDHIDKQSQKLNMTSSEYQEWSAVMQHCGTSIDSTQSSMKTLSAAAETGNEAFETLGISMADIESMDSEELFSATITALQNMEDETERTYTASQLLGRGATELGALLNTSAEDTQEMKDRVNELGGVLSNDAIKAGAAYTDSLQDMKTAFSGLKNNMLVEFLPAVTTVMDGLTEIFSGDSS
jgi:predicted lactoylglutathione lyase